MKINFLRFHTSARQVPVSGRYHFYFRNFQNNPVSHIKKGRHFTPNMIWYLCMTNFIITIEIFEMEKFYTLGRKLPRVFMEINLNFHTKNVPGLVYILLILMEITFLQRKAEPKDATEISEMV